MRRLKKVAPEHFEPTLNRKSGEEIIRETREYELITPLFGGGVETKRADEISVVRATEVRGQLRFWWRATRGGEFSRIDDLKKHEDAIFGSMSSPSSLQVEVEMINAGDRKIAFRNVWNDRKQKNDLISFSRYFEYVAFPLQPEDQLQKNDEKWQSAPIHVDVSFRVRLHFPRTVDDELKLALWAWENFGGLGARTRRGFGAIKRIDANSVPRTKKELSQEMHEVFHTNGIVSRTAMSNFPVLKGASLQIVGSDVIDSWKTKTIAAERSAQASRVGNNRPYNSQLDKLSPLELAWCFLVAKLQNFRQSPRTLLVHNGRSAWPEPDAIRRITGDHATENPRYPRSKERSPKHLVGNKFPRAQFGLPIEFKFKDPGDPAKKTLEGRDKEQARLSSPLILRPIACKDGVIGIALALNTAREAPNGLHLKGYSAPIITDINTGDIAAIQPMLLADPKETDVLRSFLEYLFK